MRPAPPPPGRRSDGRRATHHIVAATAPTVKATDSHGAACSGATPDNPHIAASSRTHRKLE